MKLNAQKFTTGKMTKKIKIECRSNQEKAKITQKIQKDKITQNKVPERQNHQKKKPNRLNSPRKKPNGKN